MGRAGQFISELRRRRVFRALGVYAVAAFAILQVIEPMMHGLDLPPWILRATIWALAAGFPVTAVLSWVFDLGLTGVTRTPEATPADGNPAGASRHRTSLAVLAAASALVGAGLAGLAGWHLWGRVPEVGPEGRITVAVADFVNETKEPDLDGLSGQLITSLEQSQRLRVLTRSRMVDVLRQLGKPAVPVVDEVLGREMALAAGVRALVVATIRRFDQLYAIDLKVLDPGTSEYFFTLKEEKKGKEEIPGMLDRLSELTRARLRETPAQVSTASVKIGEATTRSHEAWQHYFEGQKLEDAGELWRAIRSYQRAVDLDPRFAMALYRIAYLNEFVQLPGIQPEAMMATAYEEIDRVPAKERLLIQAWKAHIDGRAGDAHALYAQAATAYPLDKDVLYLAGDLYLHEGNAGEALPWFERAVALDPAWPEAQGHVILDALPLLGRSDEALERARRYERQFPGRRSRVILLHALNGAGRPEEAVDVAQRAAATDPRWPQKGALANSLILADRLEEAEEVLLPFTAASMPGEERLEATLKLICVLVQQGRRNEAIRVTRAMGGTPEALIQGKPFLLHQVLWSILMNERDHRPALREGETLLSLGLGSGGMFTGYYFMGENRLAASVAPDPSEQVARAGYDSLTAWSKGDSRAAVEGLRRVAARDTSGRTFWNWWLAYVAFDAGVDDEAIAATSVYDNARTQISTWRGWGLARLQYKKALALERRGDVDGARKAVERMLGWWKRADPDLPLLAEAKALCKRLDCRPAYLLPRK